MSEEIKQAIKIVKAASKVLGSDKKIKALSDKEVKVYQQLVDAATDLCGHESATSIAEYKAGLEE